MSPKTFGVRAISRITRRRGRDGLLPASGQRFYFHFEFIQAFGQGIVFLFQRGIVGFQFFVQSLDGGERDAAFVHDRYVFVIRAVEAEGGVEILGHGTHVFEILRCFVIPFGNRQRGDFGQDSAGIEGPEVFLGIAIAGQGHAIGIDGSRQIRGALEGANADDVVVAVDTIIADVNILAFGGFQCAAGVVAHGDVIGAAADTKERIGAHGRVFEAAGSAVKR